jgi:hypothetical protein
MKIFDNKKGISMLQASIWGTLQIVALVMIAIVVFDFTIVNKVIPILKDTVVTNLSTVDATTILQQYDFIIFATRCCIYGLMFVVAIYLTVKAFQRESEDVQY